MRIGNIEIANPVILAPMAGVTDLPFRILAKELGCGLVYTEMVSDKGINYRNCHTLEMLKTDCRERPVALQLFGAEPQSIAKAAKYVESLGVADIIDLNMGCPAPKVVKNNEGSALMKEPLLAFKIMKAVVEAVDLPVTVKFRKGWDNNNENAVEMAQLAEKAGVCAVAVHGRTREQYYSGQADWDIIKEVKAAVSIPVIGNGDIRTCQDAKKMLEKTGCDAIMIGRGCQGNPWIFQQVSTFLNTGQIINQPSIEERVDLIKRHLAMLIELKGEYIGAREMRKHATWYTKGLPFSADYRLRFNQAESETDFHKVFADLLKNYHKD